MGDHPNGPSKIKIDSHDKNTVQLVNNQKFIEKYDGQTIPITELFMLNPVKFLG